MPDDNVATIERVYDALAARDASAIQEVFAPDVTIRQSPELPWGGDYEGLDGAFTFFLTLVEHIESQVTTESLFAASKEADWRVRYERGDTGWTPASGHPRVKSRLNTFPRWHHGGTGAL
jgi:ketosteroid isomerase-like protein